jgi:plasmid stability protein
MGGVSFRKIKDWVVGWFRSQANQHGRSLEGEVREALPKAALRRKKKIAEELRGDLQELEQKCGPFSDSAKIIRETRDARG